MRARAKAMRMVSLLVAVLLASCGSRLARGPDASVAATQSNAPAGTPIHTSAPVTDPLPLHATRRVLSQRAVQYGRFVTPILVVLQHKDVPEGQAYDGGGYPGFMYVSDGTVSMAASGASEDVSAGGARDIPNGSWRTNNAAPAPNTYYAVFLQDDTARNEWPAWRVLASPPLEAPVEVSSELRLDIVSIDAGGRTGSQLHGGSLAIVVVGGAVEVREPNGVHYFLGSGTSIFVPPQTPLQLFALDSKPATVLEFFYTLEGRPFAVGLDSSP